MRSHLERCHTDLATQVTKKGTAKKRKNDLETEDLASAVKEAEEYERQRDVYINTQDTSLQSHTKKRKLMTKDSSKKPTSSFMEIKLPLFDRRQLEFDQEMMEILICANLRIQDYENGLQSMGQRSIKSSPTFSRNKLPLL